jgi:flagellar basal-body rod modification protein FlgD
MEIGATFGKTLGDITNPGSQRVESPALNQQDFLRLMIAQMRNQNPLEPQDGTQFIAQLASFQTLAAMEEMASAVRSLAQVSELASASALVGRTVSATVGQGPDPATGMPRPAEFVSGEVTRVTFNASGATVWVDDRAIPATLVREVRG